MRDHRCPKCRGDMHTRSRDGIAVALCGECHGMWVDTVVLEALAEKSDSRAAVRELAMRLEAEPVQGTLHDCPTCENGQLEIHHHQEIEIDWCRRCHGVFLDRGELEKLSKQRKRRLDAAFRRNPDPGKYGPPEDRRSGLEQGVDLLDLLSTLLR